MHRLADSSRRFRVEDVPPRLHEKERIIHAFRDIERNLRESGGSIERELHPDNLERNWSQLMTLYQERDQMIHDEIARSDNQSYLCSSATWFIGMNSKC